MTEPTDAEIEQLYLEETGFDLNDSPAALLDFAHAVLAKWGQPAQKTVTVVPAQAAESRTIPDREIPGIVERALQELEGLVKYATSTYGHWDMRRAKGALSDLEWWARRKLAAHAQAAEPVAPDFFTVCALYEGGGEAGWLPLPGYSNETEHGVKNLVLEAARKEGYKGTATGRLTELNWEIRPVYLTPQPVAREPLTDAQIVQMSLEWPAETNDWASHIDFARAIEQAHGIKGGQHAQGNQ